MKRIILICTVFFTLLLSSCSQSGIRVYSDDYPKLSYLKSGELTDEQIDKYTSPDNEYGGFSYYISVKDDKLYIENRTDDKSSIIECFDNGYFLGVDLGEFDGWVKYIPYFSQMPEAGEEVLVSEDNCYGILHLTNRKGYIIAGKIAHLQSIGDGKIIDIWFDSTEDKWKWDTVAEFEGAPRNFFFDSDKNILYIVTVKSIVSLNADNNLTVIAETELIEKIKANSITVYNDSIYCGSRFGIYKYNLLSNEEEWFPIG